MISVNAHYDGQTYVTDQKVEAKPNQKVIITYLDDVVSQRKKRSLEEIKMYMKGGARSVPEGVSTVDYVRRLRQDDEQDLF